MWAYNDQHQDQDRSHSLCRTIIINEKITASGQRGMYRDTEEHDDEV